MTDDEMRAMPIPALQDEGILFLWVTGRAMEVGRECLRVWGYTRVDEVVWVKTNQVHRIPHNFFHPYYLLTFSSSSV
jgi:mRNA (2'-O-methyladenosine-N6-)-methyltransferase